MLAFFFKKNICDGWDNLFTIIISNVFSLVLGAASVFAVTFVAARNQVLAVLVLLACSGIVMVPVFAWGANARKIADFNTPSFAIFFGTMRAVWKPALAFGALFALLFVAAFFGIQFYLSLGGMMGLLVAAFVFWFLAVCVIALQWFIPFYFLQEDNSFVKCLKKSFIVFFDNPAFSLVIFAYHLALAALSVVLFFFVPGASGITLSATNALRLRLYKYDWLEAHPEAAESRRRRAAIPWNELLAADMEALGPRKLSSFLFPWK